MGQVELGPVRPPRVNVAGSVLTASSHRLGGDARDRGLAVHGRAVGLEHVERLSASGT